jgi:hypothetical protein
MRTLVSIFALVLMCGCANTRDAQRTGQSRGNAPQATPVVIEQPSFSDRLKYRHQQEAEQEGMAMTEVEGAMKQ